MIKREKYLSRIRPFINKPIIKIICGIRRCGKSVLLTLIQNDLKENGISENNILNINFETVEGMQYLEKEHLLKRLTSFLKDKSEKTYLFLDEIQEVLGWEKIVNAIQTEFDTDIYITGSNARLLSGDLSTYLAGRYVNIQVHPFSFAEFCELMADHTLPEKELFKKYIILGGMPFLKYMDLEYESSMQYLSDVYNSVVMKDIITYHKIREVDLLDRIIRYIMDNTGNTFSANSISKFFKSEGRKVAVDTIVNYLSICENAFLFKKCFKEDLKGKKILKINEKYYIEDHGFREALIARNTTDIQQILVNIIYIEMISRGYQVTVGKVVEKEIDFVCKKNKAIVYLQVCYLLADEKTVNREFSVYDHIKDNYPKFVLSMDEIDFSRNGIQHMNIVKFLKSPNILYLH
ncbi:MAG: ATP-binding protein [Thermotogota bacterium]